jgi:hypothetical protein
MSFIDEAGSSSFVCYCSAGIDTHRCMEHDWTTLCEILDMVVTEYHHLGCDAVQADSTGTFIILPLTT